MARASLLIIDPLTLVGQELLQARERLNALAGSIDYRHTAEDDEHQIAEFGGQPALVPPLSSQDILGDFDVIVVTSEVSAPRHEHLVCHLDSHPDAAVVDANRISCLRDRCHPSLGGVVQESRRLRPAHPALIATSSVVEVLAPLGVRGGSLAVADPVSVGGRRAVDLLAQQAAQRIQGAPVEELIDERVLAFNVVAVNSYDLMEDAAVLLPDLSLVISRSVSGIFHGHFAHLGLSFDRPVDAAAVSEALSGAAGVQQYDFPLGLDSVPDRDHILVTQPMLSPDGRRLALTIMADGLLVGGALTILDILETLV